MVHTIRKDGQKLADNVSMTLICLELRMKRGSYEECKETILVNKRVAKKAINYILSEQRDVLCVERAKPVRAAYELVCCTPDGRQNNTPWHVVHCLLLGFFKVVVTSNFKTRKAYINYDVIFTLSLVRFDFSSKLYLHCYCSSMIKKASESVGT